MAALAREFWIAAIELRAVEGRLDLPAYLANKYESPSGFAATLQSLSMPVISLSTSFKAAENSEADRAELIAQISWADESGIPWLRIFDGGKIGDPNLVESVVRTLDWWRDLRSQHS